MFQTRPMKTKSAPRGATRGTRRSGAFAAVALMSLVALASLVTAAQQASAQNVTSSGCQTAFEGSPANAYCPSGVFYVRRNDAGEKACSIHVNCSITVTVGETDRTFRNGLAAIQTFSLADTGLFDLCFSRDDDTTIERTNVHDGWRMDVKPGCDDATDSETAESDGLSLDEE